MLHLEVSPVEVQGHPLSVRVSLVGRAGTVTYTVDHQTGPTHHVADGPVTLVFATPGGYPVHAVDALGRTASIVVVVPLPTVEPADPTAPSTVDIVVSGPIASPVGGPGDRPAAEPDSRSGSAARRTRKGA